MKKLSLTILIMLMSCIIFAQDEARLMRFPAIHGNQIVFTYAGDLYTVARNGGIARKLTNHEGFEMSARFSPDGRKIAFTDGTGGTGNLAVVKLDGTGYRVVVPAPVRGADVGWQPLPKKR